MAGWAQRVAVSRAALSFFTFSEKVEMGKMTWARLTSSSMATSCAASKAAIAVSKLRATVPSMPWYWLPFSAAVSCTGGGTLMDIATGREPRTFQGEPYEEIALLGSLLLLVLWALLDRVLPGAVAVMVAMPVAWLAMLLARLLVVQRRWRSWRLGD